MYMLVYLVDKLSVMFAIAKKWKLDFIKKIKIIDLHFKHVMINNNQSILEGLIRAMPQLTERNQLM